MSTKLATLKVEQEQLDKWKFEAWARQISLSELIRRSVEEKIQREQS